MLKDYYMIFLYHPDKANFVAGALILMTIGSVSHFNESKKDLGKDVHRFSRFGMSLEKSLNRGFMVHNNSVSSLVVEVNSKKHFDK